MVVAHFNTAPKGSLILIHLAFLLLVRGRLRPTTGRYLTLYCIEGAVKGIGWLCSARSSIARNGEFGRRQGRGSRGGGGGRQWGQVAPTTRKLLGRRPPNFGLSMSLILMSVFFT